ncbi:GNAT family N-acetyltransferase [Thalassococcus sp. BH17M4-6]|uniref:GNAT family N-acetyltransferase n=1 Tax=Thalassococcus sp. BH17M4-6 TaxID=3413148 RepID=UPI003BD7CF23
MAEERNAAGQRLGPRVAIRLPRPRPTTADLAGRYVSLTPTQPDDAGPLFDAFAADTSGAGWTYLPQEPFATQDAFAHWLAPVCDGDDPVFYTIRDANGVPQGLASYLRITPDMGVIEVGNIHFAPALQATTGATEAMYLMMQHVFDDLGYRRYEWKCNALNAPSRRAAIRLGFTYEGTFRQAAVVKGRNRDTAWYAMLDSEWPAQKARFERWLSPHNFDAGGAQIAALADA